MGGNNLVGRCGLYCGSCLIFAVSHGNAPAGRRDGIAAASGCSPQQVTCDGCSAPRPNDWRDGCDRLACLDERGLVFCDDCDEVGYCSKYAQVNERYGGAPRRNLARRRAVGNASWLAEQASERACPACGKAKIYHERSCLYCGKNFTAGLP